MTESSTMPPEWFTTALASEPRTDSVEVEGVTLRYRIWGEGGGDSVILIHGGAAHARWWDHIAPLLAEGSPGRQREVIAVDLSGHGDSDHRSADLSADRGGDYSVELWATETLAIAALATSPAPVLIGHSLGGVVALQAAMRSGEELGGIVIVDSPIVHFTPEEDAAADRMAFGPTRLHQSREALVARFRPIPDQFSLDYVARHVADVSVVEVGVGEIGSTDVAAGGWRWKFDSKIFDRAPRLPSLAPLSCRAAFFRGENGMVSDDMADKIVEGLGSDLTMVKVPDAGHALMLDQPVALATGLRTVLAAWERPSHP